MPESVVRVPPPNSARPTTMPVTVTVSVAANAKTTTATYFTTRRRSRATGTVSR